MHGRSVGGVGGILGVSPSPLAQLLTRQGVETIRLDAVGPSGAGGRCAVTLCSVFVRIIMPPGPVGSIRRVRSASTWWGFAWRLVFARATTAAGFTVTVSQVDEAVRGENCCAGCYWSEWCWWASCWGLGYSAGRSAMCPSACLCVLCA